jgi:hypothetical protein
MPVVMGPCYGVAAGHPCLDARRAGEALVAARRRQGGSVVEADVVARYRSDDPA